MPRFAANLTYLFKELPFLDRFEAAAEAGFQGVEVLFPYDDAATEIVRRLKRADLPMVLMNTPPPNWTGGPRGFAAVPDSQGRFRLDFRRTLRYAERLRPHHIHIMAGVAEGPEAFEVFVDNLRWACAEAPKQSLTIEPLNTEDMPGYFLNSFDLAATVIDQVGAPNLGLQFDVYHASKLAEDPLSEWHAHAARIRHVQIGGLPDRGEPDAAQYDFAGFFAAVDAAGYEGFVSAEYIPNGPTEDGLGWMALANA